MKNKILIALPWVLLVSGIIIFFTFFNKKSEYKDKIKLQHEIIKSITNERNVYREWKDDAVRALREKDSLLQIKYKTNTIRYEKIPVTVGNYSDDELKRAVEEYR